MVGSKPLLVLLALIANSCTVGSDRHAAPWFYVVAADPQLYMKQKDDAYWRATVDGLNRLSPDFVIVCGDLIAGANDAKKWLSPTVMAKHEKLANDYLKVASRLKVPLYNVAGNHDVALQPSPHTINWYTKRFGRPWYSFEHKNSLFLILESNLIKDGAGAPAIAAQQWQWFLKTLQASSKRDYQHKTVYMHHPVCRERVDEDDDYFNLPKTKRFELLKLLHEHGFDAVFCGHFHRNAYVRDGKLELITTASCCVPLGKDPRGLRIVKVFQDRLDHSYHEIQKLPKAVRLNPADHQTTESISK